MLRSSNWILLGFAIALCAPGCFDQHTVGVCDNANARANCMLTAGADSKTPESTGDSTTTDAATHDDIDQTCPGPRPSCARCDTDLLTQPSCVQGTWTCAEGALSGELDCQFEDYPSCELYGGELCCDPAGEQHHFARCPTPSQPICKDGSTPRKTCPEVVKKESIPSKQNVTFLFRSSDEQTWYLVTRGRLCSTMEITPVDTGIALRLGIPYQCICECNPPVPHPEKLQLLQFDTPTQLTWDAREVHLTQSSVDCAERGWPAGGIQTVTGGVSQPVSPGTYRATFSLFKKKPDQCSPDSEPNTLMCSKKPGVMPSFGFGLCDGTETVSVEFTLPESGDITVPVWVGAKRKVGETCVGSQSCADGLLCCNPCGIGFCPKACMPADGDGCPPLP